MKKYIAALLLAAIAEISISAFAVPVTGSNVTVNCSVISNSGAYINQAGLRLKQLDISGAISILDNAISVIPNDKELYLNRGYLKQIANDLNGALEDYNAALKIDGSYAYAYNNRGVLKVSLKDIKGAMQDYETALNISPNYSDVYYNRANLKYMLDDNKGALADYDKAIELNPKDSDAFNNRGVVKKRMNLNVGALSDYSQAIALNPNDSIAYANRGRLKKLYFDNEGAAIDLDQAVALAENQVFIKNVKPLISKQHYIAAIPDISAIINSKSNTPISNPTPKLYNQNQEVLASSEVNTAPAVNKSAEPAKTIAQNTAYNTKPSKPANAGNTNKLSDRSNNGASKKSSTPTFNAGVASVKMAEAPDIRTTQVAAAATTNKKLAESYYIRGLQKCVLRDLRGALADLDKAVQNNPKYADAYFYRAAIRKELGDTEGFKQDYSTAIKMNPKLQQYNDTNALAMIN